MSPIAGLPFTKDSEEARAIRRIIAEADDTRATRGRRGLTSLVEVYSARSRGCLTAGRFDRVDIEVDGCYFAATFPQ